MLVSWAVTRGPSANPKDRRLAVRTEDHPLDYADFEGLIPKGEYGGGTVILWEYASYSPANGDPAEAVQQRRDQVRRAWRTHARRLGAGAHAHEGEARELAAHQGARRIRRGRRQPDVALPQVGQHDAHAQADRAARAGEGPESAKRSRRLPPSCRRNSVRSPRRRRRARTGSTNSNTTAIAGTRRRRRRGRSSTRARGSIGRKNSPPSRRRGRLGCKSALIDGEAVVLDEKGVSQFPALVAALEKRRSEAIVFVAFDLLSLDGADLRKQPLAERQSGAAQDLLSEISAAHPRRRAYRGRRPHGVRAGGRGGRGGHRRQGPDGALRIRAQPLLGEDQGLPAHRCRSSSATSPRPNNRISPRCMRRSKSRRKAALCRRHRHGIQRGAARAHPREALARRPAKPPADLEGEWPKGIKFVKQPLRAEIRFGGWTGDGHLRQARFLAMREDLPVHNFTAKQPKPPPAKHAASRCDHPRRAGRLSRRRRHQGRDRRLLRGRRRAHGAASERPAGVDRARAGDDRRDVLSAPSAARHGDRDHPRRGRRRDLYGARRRRRACTPPRSSAPSNCTAG